MHRNLLLPVNVLPLPTDVSDFSESGSVDYCSTPSHDVVGSAIIVTDDL